MSELVPIEPFRNWLAGEQRPGEGTIAFADRLGVKDRRLWDWQNVTERVHLDLVDKVLMRCDQTWMLNELYPPAATQAQEHSRD